MFLPLYSIPNAPCAWPGELGDKGVVEHLQKGSFGTVGSGISDLHLTEVNLQEHQAGMSCINKPAEQTCRRWQRTSKAQGQAKEWWLGEDNQEDEEVLPG